MSGPSATPNLFENLTDMVQLTSTISQHLANVNADLERPYMPYDEAAQHRRTDNITTASTTSILELPEWCDKAAEKAEEIIGLLGLEEYSLEPEINVQLFWTNNYSTDMLSEREERFKTCQVFINRCLEEVKGLELEAFVHQIQASQSLFSPMNSPSLTSSDPTIRNQLMGKILQSYLTFKIVDDVTKRVFRSMWTWQNKFEGKTITASLDGLSSDRTFPVTVECHD